MYIKNKTVEDDKVIFEVSPIFSTAGLVKRCRNIVDDYFTFTDFVNYSQKVNFRKYCLDPVIENYRLIAIYIRDLKYKDHEFLVEVKRNGIIIFNYPDEMEPHDKDAFVSRFERMIQYVM